MIPNILHFVFGMREDFGGKPFSLVHYLAIESAVQCNNPSDVHFYYQFEPHGFWWDEIKSKISLKKITAPTEIFGNPLLHVAHQADVVRLEALRTHGGVYLDLDTISIKALSAFNKEKFVIGQQFFPKYAFYDAHLLRIATGIRRLNIQAFTQPKIEGLCNAVMLSEKDGFFVTKWIESYRNFRSRGMDDYWAEHSVALPMQLANEYPEQIKVLNPYKFHYPLYNNLGLQYLFEKTRVFKEAYIHHLWESHSWHKYLSKLTVELIMNNDSTYNIIARKYLPKHVK
jgi:hypothetical protein